MCLLKTVDLQAGWDGPVQSEVRGRLCEGTSLLPRTLRYLQHHTYHITWKFSHRVSLSPLCCQLLDTKIQHYEMTKYTNTAVMLLPELDKPPTTLTPPSFHFY